MKCTTVVLFLLRTERTSNLNKKKDGINLILVMKCTTVVLFIINHKSNSRGIEPGWQHLIRERWCLSEEDVCRKGRYARSATD